jgi:uncharacterized protein (DUF3820 family)
MKTPSLSEKLALLLSRVAEVHMPFGKYGPQNFPPRGVPLYDLPYEYLAWFERRGFPQSELGELMQLVYQAKADGADAMFEPLRAERGRTRLRPTKKRHYSFE